MQQVVRFSKPIEIDGFPIPWHWNSRLLIPVLRSRTSLQYTHQKLLSISVYSYRCVHLRQCSKWNDESERKRERVRGRERELAAFITAFSPCHGFSLRHSLRTIEWKAASGHFSLSICTHTCTHTMLTSYSRILSGNWIVTHITCVNISLLF